MNTRRYYFKLIMRRFILPLSGFLLAYYIKLVLKTSRIEIIKDPEAAPYFDALQPAIYAFWHGRLMMMCGIHPFDYNMHVLSSKNEIGTLTYHCMQHFGIQLIRGSARNPNKPDRDKGGREALKEMLRTLKEGYPIGITPDGPLGPRHEVNRGVIKVSILSQKPIIPLTYASKRGYYAKSWDRFLIPYPFTKLCFKMGKPVFPLGRSDSDIEAYAEQLKETLNNDMQELDKYVR